MSSDNDIIGGNSGSPLINAKGEVIGAIFDGNIHSLGGDYYFDDKLNRAVSVSTAAITEALNKVYGQSALDRGIDGTLIFRQGQALRLRIDSAPADEGLKPNESHA